MFSEITANAVIFYPQKSHRRPGLRCEPVIECKGTKRRAKCKEKRHFSWFFDLKNGRGYNNLLVLGMFLVKTSLIICWFDLLLLTLRVNMTQTVIKYDN